MTTTESPHEGEQTLSPLPPSLSSMSTLWIPLHETIEHWAAFAQGAITIAALFAVGNAFHGLAWETKALRHYSWADNERRRSRLHKQMHWLESAVQDLDCAIDQWQQALSWLNLAGNDDEQQDPASMDAIRTLMEQTHEHQLRRRVLHRQVFLKYQAVKQQRCQHDTQEGPL